jgi:hypothetical protein
LKTIEKLLHDKKRFGYQWDILPPSKDAAHLRLSFLNIVEINWKMFSEDYLNKIKLPFVAVSIIINSAIKIAQFSHNNNMPN